MQLSLKAQMWHAQNGRLKTDLKLRRATLYYSFNKATKSV
jgi:hypothetical protein